jgi:ATP-dependent RNA helicase A
MYLQVSHSSTVQVQYGLFWILTTVPSVIFYLSSCGDACATIAASTCFPEPFETPSDRRRLGWVHKQFSGRRHSDHVAMLSAYQAWEDARSVDENAEMQFCDSRQLNLSTLRMTSEAQVAIVQRERKQKLSSK